jgi:hypothetical protein
VRPPVSAQLNRRLVPLAALALALALVLTVDGRAQAKPAKRHAAAHRPAPAQTQERSVAPPAPVADSEGSNQAGQGSDDGSGDAAKPAADAKAGGKNVKTKTYTFGAMDVEGKLKTPQLLYFLNRVKLELDMSAPDKRSFMKELGQSADDKSL